MRPLAHQSWGPLRRHQQPITEAWALVTEGELQRERARHPGMTRLQARRSVQQGKRAVLIELAEAELVGLRRGLSPQTKAALGVILAVGTGRMK